MREVWVVERRDEDCWDFPCRIVVGLGCIPIGGYLIFISPPFNHGEWAECSSAVITVGPFGRRIGEGLVRAAEKVSLDPAELKPSAPRRFSPRRLGMAMIGVYRRHLSPRLPIRCPYRPSCSAYGYEAIKRYGMIQGSRIILHRLSRCSHKVVPGTRDPLP
jgi:putative membrane protein insertion efficiency factor